MAHFKGDRNFKSYYDDVRSNESSDEFDELDYSRDPNRRRRQWLDEHFEVLQELYVQFRRNGTSVFGDAFFQLGDFGLFIDFIYQSTVLSTNADLLKPRVVTPNVGAVGLSTWRESRLPGLQTDNHRVPTGDAGEGVGRSWSRAVGT